MIRQQQSRRAAGFTLIEVIVAMFVIAIGLGSLLSTLTASASSVGRLRDRSFAQWIALNHISESRLANPQPGVGVTTGTIDNAGSSWNWRQEIIDQDVAGILRIEVGVAPAAAPATAAPPPDADSGADFHALATAYGFLGTSVAAPNGREPVWSLPPPRTPGSANPASP